VRKEPRRFKEAITITAISGYKKRGEKGKHDGRGRQIFLKSERKIGKRKKLEKGKMKKRARLTSWVDETIKTEGKRIEY